MPISMSIGAAEEEGMLIAMLLVAVEETMAMVEDGIGIDIDIEIDIVADRTTVIVTEVAALMEKKRNTTQV